LNGVGVDTASRVGESPLAQVHFTVRVDPANPPGKIDTSRLARLVSEATRLWDDDFLLALERVLGEEHARLLHDRYANALPDGYKAGYEPSQAVADVATLEQLEAPGQLAVHLVGRNADVRFKVFRHSESMTLSTLLPVLHSLGVGVTDERPYEVRRGRDEI